MLCKGTVYSSSALSSCLVRLTKNPTHWVPGNCQVSAWEPGSAHVNAVFSPGRRVAVSGLLTCLDSLIILYRVGFAE